jgi:hypothetical protein
MFFSYLRYTNGIVAPISVAAAEYAAQREVAHAEKEFSLHNKVFLWTFCLP